MNNEEGMTRDELLALPASVGLQTAAKALGIGRNQAYDLAAAGEFPCRVLRLGSRYRVATEDLLRHLGVSRHSETTPVRPIDDLDQTLVEERRLQAGLREALEAVDQRVERYEKLRARLADEKKTGCRVELRGEAGPEFFRP